MTKITTVWRKSSRSNDQTLGCCVEVAATPDEILVRDSKDADGPRLSLTPGAFAHLLDTIKRDA